MERFSKIVLWLTNQIKYLVMFCVLGIAVSIGAYAGEAAQTHGVPIWVAHMISGGVSLAVPSLAIWALTSLTVTVAGQINKGVPQDSEE